MTTFPFETREERDRKAQDAKCAAVWDEIAKECEKPVSGHRRPFTGHDMDRISAWAREQTKLIEETVEELREQKKQVMRRRKIVNLQQWRLVCLLDFKR